MRIGPLAIAVLGVVGACRDGRVRAARDAGVERAASRSVGLRGPSIVAPARPVACPWKWSDETALTLDAPADAPFDFEAVCSASQLSVVWRSGASAALTSRALRQDATWSAPSALGDDVSTLGRPYAASTAVWVAWTTPTGTLRSARVDGAVMRSSDAIPALHTTFRSPFVLFARGDHALVASTFRRRLVDQVIVHRVGVGSAPPSGALLSEGSLVAASTGARPRLVTMTNIPRSQGGPWHLKGWRLDASVAMTLAAPAAEGAFGVMPEGGAASSADLPVGIGRFEFTRTLGERTGAMLFQTVLGAERGAPRVAWFGDDTPVVMTLPVAVTSLGATFDATAGDAGTQGAEILWWGDQNALERATVTPAGLGAPTRIGARLATEFTVYEAARNTRWVTCGAERWRVTARREGASVRLGAAREACEVEGR
ncbi:MAG: hypothetical protein U0326_22770 [Polyangiales bacterium]